MLSGRHMAPPCIPLIVRMHGQAEAIAARTAAVCTGLNKLALRRAGSL